MADSTTNTRPQIDDPERQPLLAKQPEVPAIVVQETDGAESEIPLVDEEPKKRTSVWMIVWYIVIFSLCAVGLGFFIKAFIDADDMDFDLKAALFKALGGGVSGAAAMVLQVLLLMPLRTVMNYQYRFGTSTVVAIRTLYADGGMGRYYQGLAAALVQGPVSRFGDTAANAGILALLASNAFLKDLPPFVKTVFASLAAAVFRMTLTPVDTLKTTLQAQGKPGWGILARRIRTYGIWTLWYGALATAAATFVGHYPWFATYNTLQDVLPPPHSLIQKLLRQAFIGFVASIISDSISNSLRVVKTYRQVNDVRIGYFNAARAVVAVDGLTGLFGRGLKTRIIANGCQSIMFSILWKLFMDLWDQQGKNA